MEAKKKRLTLDLAPEFQRRLKVIAALKGISMRQYCQTAIDKELTKDETSKELTKDETSGASGQRSGLSDAERFAELRAKHFHGKALPGNGVDFIREARESRNVS